MDPGIEWVHPAATQLPFDGTVRGLAAVVRAAFRKNEDGSGPRVSADTFLEFGDGVLVAGRFIGDHGMEDPFLHECSVRAGRIEQIREYPAESRAGSGSGTGSKKKLVSAGRLGGGAYQMG